MDANIVSRSAKKNVLGVLVNATDYAEAVQLIMDAAKTQKSYGVTALAVHGVMTGALDDEHRFRLNQFNLVVPDGQPVRWALNRLHGTMLRDRVYGPTLTLKVCQSAAKQGYPVYFYGSSQIVLEQLSNNLRKKFPALEIAGMQPSKFRQLTAEEKLEAVNRIKHSGAKILFVGLGCPRQEVWVYEHLDILNMPMLAVGAAFDFHAGNLPQAPPQLQNNGLEWLFRLVQEPRRLWKRYLYLNPSYVCLILLQWLKLRTVDPANNRKPEHELRYG